MLEYHYSIIDLRVESIPSPEGAEQWLRDVCRDFGLGLRDVVKTVFEAPVPGHAYTLVAVLSGSHAVIHTAPEEKWINVAFASCKPIKTQDLIDMINNYFKPENARFTSFIASAPARVIG